MSGARSDPSPTDVAAYRFIPCSTTARDQRSLLSLLAAARAAHGTYVYLEVGSYRGSSLQPLVVDPACTRVFSLDPRPARTPDARGDARLYDAVSSAEMLASLARIPGAEVAKVRVFDAPTTRVSRLELELAPHVAFVDGEHTDEAALADARFCHEVMGGRGCIVFHDAHVVFGGIQRFCDTLAARDVAYSACLLPDALFVLELGAPVILSHPDVRQAAEGAHLAYLWALERTRMYRDFYSRPLFSAYRQLRNRLVAPLGRARARVQGELGRLRARL